MTKWVETELDDIVSAYNLNGIHPAANLLPLITGSDYQALCDSINLNGLEVPVVLTHDGHLIDGRNRLRALYATGQTEKFTFLDEAYAKDYYGYVIRLNLDRRHLTNKQKKEIYIKLREVRGVQKAGGDRKSETIVANPTMISKPTQTQYAEDFGVSRDTVNRWEADAKVLDKNPEVKQAVISGEKDIDRAVEEAKNPPSKKFITLTHWRDGGMDSVPIEDSTQTFNKQENDSIEWADWSWNPVTGCKHECSYCYARDIANRFWGDSYGFEPTLHPGRLRAPYNTKLPKDVDTSIARRNVFANSMSDLYGRWVPQEWIDAVFKSMSDNPQWNFLTLTKFPKRAAELQYPENVWIGTSVDLQVRVKAAEEAFERIECGVRWLSIEPLLEPLTFSKPELFDWVVLGGASKSSQTPDWTPPADWLIRVASQFLDHGAKIYLKTNGRPREFPGVITPETADESFRYLRG